MRPGIEAMSVALSMLPASSPPGSEATVFPHSPINARSPLRSRVQPNTPPQGRDRLPRRAALSAAGAHPRQAGLPGADPEREEMSAAR
jgi:hypothetical protein